MTEPEIRTIYLGGRLAEALWEFAVPALRWKLRAGLEHNEANARIELELTPAEVAELCSTLVCARDQWRARRYRPGVSANALGGPLTGLINAATAVLNKLAGA